ncbi:hypothetical protein LEMLEM_LOCUS3891 [Lemmus lemmus]
MAEVFISIKQKKQSILEREPLSCMLKHVIKLSSPEKPMNRHMRR